MHGLRQAYCEKFQIVFKSMSLLLNFNSLNIQIFGHVCHSYKLNSLLCR